MNEDLCRGRLRQEPVEERGLLFRGMSATDSEEARNSGWLHIGISGRVPSEWVADLRRNQWPDWVGIRNPDNEYAMIDSTIVRAHQHAAGAKGGTTRRKPSGAARGA